MNIAALAAFKPPPRVLSVREVFLIISFFGFLYPISDFEGRSVNYSFVVFPLFTLLLYGKLRKPPETILLAIAIFTLIFLIATLYQFEFLDLGIRRLISFLLFMTLFAFVFVKVDSEMIAAFKIVTVLISTYFSLAAIGVFVASSDSVHYEAKDLVGSQRYGFVYLLGLWIAFFFQPSRKLYIAGKYLVVGIIFAGLFLTFSRSSIVALLASFSLYAFASSWGWFFHPRVKDVLRGVKLVVAVGLLVFFTYYYLPLTFHFYGDRLFGLLSSGSLTAHLMNPETSEGARIYIMATVLDYVMANPLTGSGYLGIWALPNASAGSAHNQYIDVLLRTGFIGFAAYSYLIFQVLKHAYMRERDLFWGLVGVLVYGLFHETFKESQGAFVLAFLLGMVTQRQQNRRKILLKMSTRLT